MDFCLAPKVFCQFQVFFTIMAQFNFISKFENYKSFCFFFTTLAPTLQIIVVVKQFMVRLGSFILSACTYSWHPEVQFVKMNRTVKIQLSATKLINPGDPQDLPDPFFEIQDAEGNNSTQCVPWCAPTFPTQTLPEFRHCQALKIPTPFLARLQFFPFLKWAATLEANYFIVQKLRLC